MTNRTGTPPVSSLEVRGQRVQFALDQSDPPEQRLLGNSGPLWTG